MHPHQEGVQRNFPQQQVKTAIRKSFDWGNFLKRLKQMYPVHETDLSVRTEIEELPKLSPNSHPLHASLNSWHSREGSWVVWTPSPMVLLSVTFG